jgi:hypothetical protein
VGGGLGGGPGGVRRLRWLEGMRQCGVAGGSERFGPGEGVGMCGGM